MKTASAREIAWTPYPGQRSKTIEYKGLLQGEADTLDNYEMSINRFGEGGSFSPRHRHNFDQFRWAFGGPLNYSPKQDVLKDQLGFFPEGAYYGPQDIVEGSNMLIVQFGGASGQGYMSWDRLMTGTEELKRKGEFAKGVFTSINETGKRFNKDGYEAVWEHVNGRPLQYPKPRYHAPVMIDPEAFAWMPVDGATGVERRSFGVFNERGTSAFQIKIAPRAEFAYAKVPGITLLFVLAGNVRSGDVTYDEHAAFAVGSMEGAQLRAVNETLLLCFTMPYFNSEATAN